MLFRSITLNCNRSCFYTSESSIWSGQTLYDLYKKAYTPWDWHKELQEEANRLGIILFSSPFDITSVDFLEDLNMPAYKIASYEITDIPLIRRVARTGKPLFISTGIARTEDVELALETCIKEGNEQVILMKCTSSYPAPYDQMNLRVIPDMRERFDCVVGLSDHSMGAGVPVAATALGACAIEKHFIISRKDGGVDAPFSMEELEFTRMVTQIRNVEKALGRVSYSLSENQRKERKYSRSLFVVEDIKQGEVFSETNVRSIRPGIGLHTKYYDVILGKCASQDIERGTPLEWHLIR